MFAIPEPELQVSFALRLAELRPTIPMDALRETVRGLDIPTLDQEREATGSPDPRSAPPTPCRNRRRPARTSGGDGWSARGARVRRNARARCSPYGARSRSPDGRRRSAA